MYQTVKVIYQELLSFYSKTIYVCIKPIAKIGFISVFKFKNNPCLY
jgi:hypothetical protein